MVQDLGRQEHQPACWGGIVGVVEPVKASVSTFAAASAYYAVHVLHNTKAVEILNQKAAKKRGNQMRMCAILKVLIVEH